MRRNASGLPDSALLSLLHYNMANLSEKSYYIYEKANDRKLICDICNEANVRSPRFESWLDQNSYFVLVLNLAIKDNRKLHFSKGC